jgi:hypothetical protein
MFGVALIKSLCVLAITGNLHMLLFSFYGVFYFFGLLPLVSFSGSAISSSSLHASFQKIYAIGTMANTTWGMSACLFGEMHKNDNFLACTFHIGHLVLWYTILSVSLAYFFFYHFHNLLMMFITVAALILSTLLYINIGKVGRKLAFWHKAPNRSVGSESPHDYSYSLPLDSVTFPVTDKGSIFNHPFTHFYDHESMTLHWSSHQTDLDLGQHLPQLGT